MLATQKRIQSIKRHAKPHDRNRRVLSRNNRRVKSAASQSSECSDDDTNHSINTDSEWNWLDEKFDYDKDSGWGMHVYVLQFFNLVCEKTSCGHLYRNGRISNSYLIMPMRCYFHNCF